MLTILKGIIVVLGAIPLSLAALISVPLDRSGRTYHGCARLWSRFILWIFRIRVQMRGLEHLHEDRHYIYAANHASWFDIPATIVGIPDDIRIMLKRELTYVPIWGWALKYGPYIAVDRSNPKDAMRGLDKAVEQMKTGASLLLFVEGTRTRDGKLQPFRRGAFTLAARSGVPIIPVTINYSFKILPKGSLAVRPADIEIVLEKPIETIGTEGREREKLLMEEVRTVIARNFVEP
ncbi:MAG: 1-acyl-sn-glycerol-3-phosphate acyltransferase [Ignavibacteriales bacterium]|nr:1-acyl-sn-glycerol-3-phosphate acyltransferase [Ignavibacteriales bacterium]